MLGLNFFLLLVGFEVEYIIDGPPVFLISPSTDNIVFNCTTLIIVDDNFTELTEVVTIALIDSSPLYFFTGITETVIYIEDNEGQ